MQPNINFQQPRTNFNIDFDKITVQKKETQNKRIEERVNIEVNDKPKVKRKVIKIKI